jgi:hypothetical protein
MMYEITAADIQAATDVVESVAELSDSMEFESAAEVRLALIDLKRVVAGALGLIETQMINRLEDAPRRFGDKTYEVVDDGVYRADHGVILDKAQEVARRRSVNPDTGEVNTVKALEEFAFLIGSLYLSPSTTAKVGGIEAVGLDKRKVRRWEKKGRKLSVVEHHQAYES